MILDITTLLTVTVVNIVVLALMSPAVMGLRLVGAARDARWSLVTHAAAWLCMIVSNLYPESWHDRLFSTLSVAGFAFTHWLMFQALEGWLGPRLLGSWVKVLVFVIPLGYFAVFDSYHLRVGWANFLLTVQIVLLVRACFGSKTSMHGAWRMVLALGLGSMAVLTLGRGVLGAFTDAYPSFLTPHPWNLGAMLMTSLVPVTVNFAILGGWHEEAERAMHEQAITDALTRLYNRRGWLEVAVPLVSNANRNQLPLCLLMLDIDYFKKINDSYGHEKGDQTLQAVGRLLSEQRRGSDVAARVGGEEFCLLLPGADIAAAQKVDQLLRHRLESVVTELGHPLNFSAGLALLQSGESLEKLMNRADNALYAAKENGRAQLQVAVMTDLSHPHQHPTETHT